MDGFFNQYNSPEQQYPYQQQAPEDYYQQQYVPQPQYQQQSNHGSWAYQCPSAYQNQNYGYSSNEPQHYEGYHNPCAYHDFGSHTQHVDNFTHLQPLDQFDQFSPMPQESFNDSQMELLEQINKDMQEFKISSDSDIRNLENRMGQLTEILRLKQEEEACAIEVVRDDEVIIEEAHVRSEIEDSVYYDEVPELEIDSGSPISPETPIVVFDYGKFHVLPITPSPEMKTDDALVECVVEPTIVMTAQEFFGDENSSLWDEEELEDLEMREVQPLSITPPPEKIQNDDLEGCMLDLSTLFDEIDFELEEKLGSPISPSLPTEIRDDVLMKSVVKPYEIDEPSMVELPGELEIISIPVPDYYTLPPCVEEYYSIDFVYSPVDEAHKILEKGQLPWNGNFKKKMVRNFDRRGFPSWEEVTSRAVRGKFLVNSVSVLLAVFMSRKLLVFLSIDFG